MAPRTQAETRSRIIEAADRLFYTQGYSSTGINQIIEDAGVAKASLYAHFPSKEALAVAYLERRHRAWFEDLRGVVDRRRSPLRRAVAPFDFLEQWLVRVDFRGCAFLNILGEHPLPRELGARVQSHKSELRDYLRELVSPLAQHSAHAQALGDHILLLFEGAILECQVHHAVWPACAASRAAAQLLGTDSNKTTES